jgi:predicted porin
MQLSKLAIATGVALLSTSALVPTSVFAQTTSVQIYGQIDAGLEYVSKARSGAAGTPDNSIFRVQSGNLASSRIGFRGREDLGDGLSALFVLENGYSTDTGTASQSGRLFGRDAYVGLAGSMGEIEMGRQKIPFNDFGLIFDPVGPARFSTPTFDLSYIGRADNAVKYIGKYKTATVNAQYSTGYDSTIAGGSEVAGAAKVGREMGLSADYIFGRYQIGAAYDRQNGTSVLTQSDTNKRTAVGIVANFAPVRLFATYQWQSTTTGPVKADTKFYWIGAQYQVTPAVALSSAVYFYDPEGASNRSVMPTLLAVYSLSKRTDLYSEVAYMKNQSKASVGLDGAVNPGDNHSALTIGIRHRF